MASAEAAARRREVRVLVAQQDDDAGRRVRLRALNQGEGQTTMSPFARGGDGDASSGEPADEKRNCQEQTLRRRAHHDLRMSTLPLRIPPPRLNLALGARSLSEFCHRGAHWQDVWRNRVVRGARTNRRGRLRTPRRRRQSTRWAAVRQPLNGREGPAAGRRQTPPLRGELARARRAPEFPSSHRCTSSRWSCRRSGEASCRLGRCGHRKTGLRGARHGWCPARS